MSLTFDEMASRIRGLEQRHNTDTARRTLFANVSPDLRTPLASLQDCLDTLLSKRHELTAGEQQHYL